MFRLKDSKLVLILMMILISVTVIVGCNSLISPSMGNHDSEMSKIKSSDTVILQFYFKGNVDIKYNDTRKMLDEVEKSCLQALNIKLDFKWINGDEYINKIKALIDAGDSFDAFYVDNNVKDFVNGDYLLDLTKLFPQFAGKYYKKFDADEIGDILYNEKLIVIPHYLPQSKRICAVVRQDLVEKYHISEMKNFEDYENYLKTIKDNEQSLIPGSISSKYNTDYIFAESFGYYRVDNYLVAKWNELDLNIIPWEQVPEYKSAIGILNRWLINAYIKKSDPKNIVNDAYNGVISSFLIPWYTLNESYINSNTKFKFKVYPLYTDKISAKLPISIEGIAFNKNSKNAGRAIEFIEWLQSNQENYDLFLLGIEGTNYVLRAFL